MSTRIVPCLLPLLLTGACGLAQANASRTFAANTDTVKKLKSITKDCPSGVSCYRMELPLDHMKTKGKTIPVTFAVSPAKGTSKGALLLVFGGPGDSGISGLRSWLPTISKDLTDNYDIVTFDLRGTHRSGGLDCPKAAYDFTFVPARAGSAEDIRDLKQGAKTFASACPREMGLSAEDMPYYNTAQAIEDVRSFRQAMGYKSWTIHAMSYGTQFTQVYATHYPEEVEAIVLDGAVDMKADLLRFDADLNDAKNDVMEASYAACEKDESCSKFFKGHGSSLEIAALYDKVRADLEAESAWVGEGEDAISFNAYDFEYTAANATGKPESRRDFMRALAAATNPKADFSLLLKLANGESLGVAAKKAAAGDQSFSGMSTGIYYAFICNDYGMPPGTADFRANLFIQNGRSREASGVRIRTALYGELPCAYWSSTGDGAGSNQTSIDRRIPVMVVNSSADANVPAKHGYAVFESLENASLIDVKGGKHIMYGYGIACIDKPVTNFLLTHELPAQETITCQSSLLDPVR